MAQREALPAPRKRMTDAKTLNFDS